MKLMKKVWGILVLTAIVSELAIMPGYAQENAEDTKVDLSKVSCRELLKMPGEDKRLTLVFFHGFISAKKNQMMVDSIALREATNQVTDYCIDNPDATLMSAFEKYR
ncbi:HdeA family protein [Crocosphaera sp. UHCC 0190]|uniref:HdeA family protein n=1 Tax=Crocosphaera sp. UHCC 0190 TaxID=3110246 RepID=UPI002B207B3A|nr:HdeA family protein [Crocosphaera sp. UHCC 0190]MEA5508381.1 HdeA family protein [Crocosphaera sp. UHCC 0190]